TEQAGRLAGPWVLVERIVVTRTRTARAPSTAPAMSVSKTLQPTAARHATATLTASLDHSAIFLLWIRPTPYACQPTAAFLTSRTGKTAIQLLLVPPTQTAASRAAPPNCACGMAPQIPGSAEAHFVEQATSAATRSRAERP